MCGDAWSLNGKQDVGFICKWSLTSFSLKWISREVFENHEKQGAILRPVRLPHPRQNGDHPLTLPFLFSQWHPSVIATQKPPAQSSKTPARRKSCPPWKHSTRYLRRNKHLRREGTGASFYWPPFLLVLSFSFPPSSTINCWNLLCVQHLTKCLGKSADSYHLHL